MGYTYTETVWMVDRYHPWGWGEGSTSSCQCPYIHHTVSTEIWPTNNYAVHLWKKFPESLWEKFVHRSKSDYTFWTPSVRGILQILTSWTSHRETSGCFQLWTATNDIKCWQSMFSYEQVRWFPHLFPPLRKLLDVLYNWTFLCFWRHLDLLNVFGWFRCRNRINYDI